MEIADAGGRDAAYPFASSGQAGINASIQAIESLPSNGTDSSNSIPAVNQKKTINHSDKGSLDNISQKLTEDLEGRLTQKYKVELFPCWANGKRPGPEVKPLISTWTTPITHGALQGQRPLLTQGLGNTAAL